MLYSHLLKRLKIPLELGLLQLRFVNYKHSFFFLRYVMN